MTLQQLSYFLAAERHGSFSAAADALRLAQPSLSEQVRRLEAELGVELFVRSTRGLALTEAGEALRPYAEQALAATEQARESVAGVRGLQAGTAEFGIFGSAHHYRLADLVEDLRSAHPGLRLRMVGLNSSEVADMVRSGELEAALLVLPIDDHGLEVRPALRDEVLYVSADPARTARPVSAKALSAAPVVLYDARFRTEDPTRLQLAQWVQRAGFSLDPLIEVEDLTVALDLAARGVGDTIAARGILAGPHTPAGLHTASFADRIYDTFAFVTRRGARLSPATREVVRFAERHIEERLS